MQIAARPITGWIRFGGCLAAILAIQILSGAYLIERGAWSDDAAHFMNGLVVRDYLKSGLKENPMAFAERYYLSYPKIAPLMWPPLFHVSLGLFLLPGWPPGAAALVFVGLIAAWLTWRVHTIVSQLCTGWARWLAPLLVMTTPLVASLSGVVMLDIAIAACSLEAAYWLARYWQTADWKHAALFGLLTACACLTKGNGAALVLAPPALIVLTGRYDFLRRPGLYISAAIVLVLGVPLLALSANYDAAIGDFAPVTMHDVVIRVQYYSVQLWRQLGPGLLGFALLGMFAVVRRRREQEGEVPLGAALIAVLVANAAFHIFNPHRAAVARYLTVGVAPIVALAFFGVWDAARRVYPVYWREAMRGLFAAAIVISSLMFRPAPPMVRPIGYRMLVESMITQDQLAGRRVLVVSDETGEGAFVSEAAMANLARAPIIVRGSKVLASDTWNGLNLKLHYSSSTALYQDLKAMGIDYVVLDFSDKAASLPYFGQAKSVADANLSVQYTVSRQSVGTSRTLALYGVPEHAPGPPKPVPARHDGPR